ncbi:HepT-like ribonuclease domain-containing protein [Limnothrix redekei]|uniref:DUF86 domain-containing protein n=1 Tax=Limnothrix redekei LRLZ20PSL1 TaxID=3112953 RepID=A0ABW7CBC0_9CYAN
MIERRILLERLEEILEALERIPDRLQDISKPEDFLATKAGRSNLDAICMVLLAVGEAFKAIDKRTEGAFLIQYPEIPWKKIFGLRNLLAHTYFDVDEAQIFNTCHHDIPELVTTVQKMIQDSQDQD